MNSQDEAIGTGGGVKSIDTGIDTRADTPADTRRVQSAAKFRVRFPVRIKLLLAVFALLTTTVVVITAFMAREFGDDKIAYVNDLAAVVAGSVAAESATVLREYLQNMDALSVIASEPAGSTLTARLFARLPEFVSVIVAEHGVATTAIYDRKVLDALGIVGDDLVTRALARVTTIPSTDADTVSIATVTMPGAETLLVLARAFPTADGQSSRLLLACIRLKELSDTVERGRGFRSVLVDSKGQVLVAGRQVAGAGVAAPGWIRPMFERNTSAQAGVLTREFTTDGTAYVGAIAGLSVGGVAAITAIPRSAAYLTARDLLNNLMLVSMALIVAGAVVALLLSRRLTTPIEKLAFAAERIGQGDFDTRILLKSSDEIGALALTFNGMAAGLRQRELALVQAQRALVHSEKMSAFGQLSAGIAHEVNNPLAGILGHAQLAMRRLGPDSPAKASLDMIAQESRRCSEIISNLMRFARQDKPQFLPMNVNEVVNAALSIVDHQLSLNGIRIVRESGDNLPPVDGDLNQIQQVLVNLAINAQQAMGEQGGELYVRTRASGEEVIIEVQDSGPGIPPDLQTRIFEPFFTTKAAGQGTGLGLSVSYGIIENHGGRIKVDSPPGQGATFVITLPAAASALMRVSPHGDIPDEMTA